MQRGKHSSGYQRAWPYHTAGPDQITSSNAGKGVAQDLGGENEQYLIHDAEVLLVEFDLLNDDLANVSMYLSSSIIYLHQLQRQSRRIHCC